MKNNFKLVLFLLVLVAVFLSSCEFELSDLDDNDDSLKEIDYSIGITNVSNSKDWGDMPALGQPVINHKITTEKSIFSYEEEVEINVELGAADTGRGYIKDEGLFIKIKESEFYEIVGESEYFIEDFCFDNYYSKINNKYPIKLKFIIKPIKQSLKVSTIEFLFKFNFHKDLPKFEGNLSTSHSDYRFNFNEEYFFIIKGMYFFNDSKNMKLSLNNNDLERDTLLKDYNNGIIDKKTFYRGMMDSFLLDDIELIIKDNYIDYFSKNLKFRIEFLNQNNEFFKALSNFDIEYYGYHVKEKDDLEVVEMLFEILKENFEISSEKIEIEIKEIYDGYAWIYERTYMFNDLKEYDDYEDYMFDYICVVE